MELNKQNMKKIMIIIAFGIILYCLLNRVEVILGFTGHLLHLLFPFILGGIIAFILNIPVTKIENFFKKKKVKPWVPVRSISIMISLVMFIGIILLICFLLIPELVQNIQLLIQNIPAFLTNVQNWILELVDSYPEIQTQISDTFNDTTNFNNIIVAVLNYVVNGSVNFVGGVVSSLFTIFTAIVFAIYMLSQKEYLLRGVKKLMYAYLKPKYINKIEEIAKLSNHTFSKFISGQCVEAVLLGCIFFVVMTLFRFPYALIISVLISITALIPMFGAMIAMVIGALLIAVTNPWQAVFFIIVFQVIQQIENNFIYPKVVGKSVGLSSIWTLLAIILGGSLLGVGGMIIGLPLASILYAILKEETNEQLEKKKIKV